VELRDALGTRVSARVLAAIVAVLSAFAVVTAAEISPVAADQVGNLSAQARTISQELVQEQLEADAFQQQYSVASEEVANDQRAITSTQLQIKGDREVIDKRLHQVQRLAIASYILNGSVTSSSGASIFAEDVRTVQSANEYATITIGNLNGAIDQLHAAQRSEQAQLAVLVRQSAQARAEQTAQATYLAQSTSTVDHMQAVQAQVTGQLEAAVAAQSAIQDRSAEAAVTSAQRSAVHRGASAPPTTTPGAAITSDNLTDPALNPFLQCVVQAESGGNYQAVSPNGLYMGAFQFSQGTWNYAAQAAGLPNLVGVPPNEATKAEQDTVAVALYALDGDRPWLGDRCS
jgi:hypothetical protein